MRVPPLVYRVLGAAGQPLPPDLRSDLGSRIGADLSHVRLHEGADAARSARSVAARAYTVGSHVVFGEGGFRPESSDGRRLLAHELAHAVREGGGRPPSSGLSVGAANDPEERAADRMAESALGGLGEATPVGTAGAGVLRRQPDAPATATAADDPWADYDVVASRGAGCDDEIIPAYCPLDLDESPVFTANADPRLGQYIQEDCQKIHSPDVTAEERAKARRRVLLASGWLPPAVADDAAAEAWRAGIVKAAATEEATLGELGPEIRVDVPDAFPISGARIHRERHKLRVDFSALNRELSAARAALREGGVDMGVRLPSEGMPDPGDPPLQFRSPAGYALEWPRYLTDQGPVGVVARAAYRLRSLAGPAHFVEAWNRRIETEAGEIERGEACASAATLNQAELGPLPTVLLTSDDAWATLREAVAASGEGWSGLNDAQVALAIAMRQFAMTAEDQEGAATHSGAIKTADAYIAGVSGAERVILAIEIAWERGYFGKAKDELVAALKENWEMLLVAVGLAAGAILAASAIPVVGWILGGLGAVALAKAVMDLARAIGRCSDATTLYELQAAARQMARAAVSAGVDAIVSIATGWAGKKVVKAIRKASRPSVSGKAPDEPPRPAPRAKPHAAKGRAAAKVADKFEEFAGACSLGSILCRTKIPDHIAQEAGAYPKDKRFIVPMPSGPFNVQKAILAGVQRGTENLRSIARANRKLWPAFDKALAAAEKRGRDWIYENGVPWEVHHIKPVFMGGDNAVMNLIPLPKSVHQQFTNWWNSVHRAFKNRFTEKEWDEIYWSDKDVAGSRVRLTEVE